MKRRRVLRSNGCCQYWRTGGMPRPRNRAIRDLLPASPARLDRDPYLHHGRETLRSTVVGGISNIERSKIGTNIYKKRVLQRTSRSAEGQDVVIAHQWPL
jgi:hypothetical protein